MMYGTAWKKDDTARLVHLALSAGFRGIDTACQPKHYNEPGVGEGIRSFLEYQPQCNNSPPVTRNDLFIQTKFTPLSGQDTSRPIPYDSHTDLTTQVQQSLRASLKNLGTTYVDSLVLHSPLRNIRDTMVVWRAFEEAVKSGTAKQIGISNIYDVAEYERIWAEAEIKPTVVQNRFYATTAYDSDLRKLLRTASPSATYQSFWTLTGNPKILQHPRVLGIVRLLNSENQDSEQEEEPLVITPAHVFYRFAMDLGIVPLNGTKDVDKMKSDLRVARMVNLLTDEDRQQLRELIGE
ncbi:aldo/keto reductase [Cladochytrium replicatum]|nr:aldo/keto reductase [Cladochytrium replicatum]